MTVEQVLELLEKDVAPVKLSNDFCAAYHMYDNSGIIVNCGNEVNGALFSLDFSEAAVARVKELGYNLVITHHPAIYGGVTRLDMKNSPQSRAIAECVKSGISVISMHLNFDAASCGIDYFLMCGLGGKIGKVLSVVEGGGYGRVYEIEPVTLNKFLSGIKENFRTERTVCHGVLRGDDRVIKKVASFCGAGSDSNSIAFAKEHGADAYISSDLKHHEIAELAECGIAVVELTHYCAESYGFNKIYQNVKTKLQIPSSYFYDERFA